VIGLIISLIIIGLIAGALARLIIPGKQNMSILMTIVLGIIGSFVGGFLGFLIFQHDPMDGFFQLRCGRPERPSGGAPAARREADGRPGTSWYRASRASWGHRIAGYARDTGDGAPRSVRSPTWIR
jgi:uncharacterized membrane protein YeaQ/YmgE (transglycosylase-associated protein family)